MVVGPDEGKGLVDGGVAFSGHQRVLQPVPLRGMVVNIVGGYQRDAGIAGQRRQLPVASGVPLQEVLLELYVHRVRAVPLPVLAQQFPGFPAPARLHQPGEGPVPAAGQEDHSAGVIAQVRRVQPRLPAVDGISQGEEAADVGVALPGSGQERQPRAVGQGQFSSGNGLDTQTVGQPGKLQGAAQVGVSQGQGGIPILSGPGQQLVSVGRSQPKRIEALGVQFSVNGNHEASLALGVLPIPAVPPLVPKQGDLSPVFPAHPVIGAGQGFPHPPEIEAPPVFDVGHPVPPIIQLQGHRLAFRPLPDHHRAGLKQRFHTIPSRGVNGYLKRAQLRRRVPGGNLHYPVQGGFAVHPGLQLPVSLRQPPLPALLHFRQQT